MRKVIPADRFIFDEDREESGAKRSALVPGCVFTMINSTSELPDFEDTTSEIRDWLNANQARIECSYNVPMRKVNAEKRMAATLIETRLEKLDIQLRVLEKEGRLLEEKIRSRTDEAMDDDQDDLMISWFLLVKQRYELVRDESELIYRRRQQELEDLHSDVEYQLRCLIEKPDYLKTSEDRALEDTLLKLLVKTVSDRSSIVDCMETDRLRYMEEDRDIEEMLKASGISDPVNLSAKEKQKLKKKSLIHADDTKQRKSLFRILSMKKKTEPTLTNPPSTSY